MPKDDDLIKEKIDDEIDLLNFDLDDLTEEDGGLDLSEKGPAQEDSDDEIIDLLDIIEKGDELGDTEGDDIAQLLGSDDTIVESDKPTDLESVSVEEKVPDVRGSIEPTEVDLDISSLEMESELSVEEVYEAAAETGEGL